MRRRNRTKAFILILGATGITALLFPVLQSNLHKLPPLLQNVGERLALLSALSDLPDSTKVLLEKRFGGVLADSLPPKADMSPHSEDTVSQSMDETPEESAISSETEAEQSAPPAASGTASDTSETSDVETSEAQKPQNLPPEIPAKYRGKMLEEDFSGSDSPTFFPLKPGYLRNYTDLSVAEIENIVSKPPALTVRDPSTPQVLIYHTHATEAFERYDSETYDTRNNWRSTDNNMNMVAVGDALARSLEANGINVVHDTTQHDYPSYNGAYDLSAATIKQYQETYPSLQILFDVHRDAIDRDGTLVRPITTVNGKKAAQLMMIAGCDDGTMNMPEWRENVRFAAAIQRQAEADIPHLMRPIFLSYRKYNFNKAPGSLLFEFGSHGNTLEECVYTAELVGKSIAGAIKGLSTEPWAQTEAGTTFANEK